VKVLELHNNLVFEVYADCRSEREYMYMGYIGENIVYTQVVEEKVVYL
jgi:hypothetical protein